MTDQSHAGATVTTTAVLVKADGTRIPVGVETVELDPSEAARLRDHLKEQ